jgi:GntR family transcriptional regulator/MocR family aminotransferase
MVVYIGSLSKAIAPAIRVGYVAGPAELIDELARLRRIVDRQGDPVLEQAVAELFREGEINRHLKKALKAYHQRRDHCCALLQEKLGHVIGFRVPDGGMALWARFDPAVSLPDVAEKALRKGLYLSNGRIYDPENRNPNATRMGFAAMSLSETEKAIEVLASVLG